MHSQTNISMDVASKVVTQAPLLHVYILAIFTSTGRCLILPRKKFGTAEHLHERSSRCYWARLGGRLPEVS
jgi:hypothetical protein